MVDDVPLYYWFTRLNTGKPVNTLASPIPSGALGGPGRSGRHAGLVPPGR
ncbi:MAG: hypothetical protein WDN04_03210 [Rhodospirillales bacterium]